MLCSSGKVADIESTTPDVFDGCPSRFICINISEVQDDLFQIAMARKDERRGSGTRAIAATPFGSAAVPATSWSLSDYATVSAKN